MEGPGLNNPDFCLGIPLPEVMLIENHPEFHRHVPSSESEGDLITDRP